MRIMPKKATVSSLQKAQNVQCATGGRAETGFLGDFREREHFSLEIRAIRPSAVFGTRRRIALRREGFAWVPELRILDKLLEVGVSPYLGFTLYLSVFRCFGWFEAVRGRLIGPKTWDRIVGFFLRFFDWH